MDEGIKKLLEDIYLEFNSLHSFLIKEWYKREDHPDLKKFGNLYKKFKYWTRKPKSNPFLHPAKIIDYRANIKDSTISSKDRGKIAKAVSDLNYKIYQDQKSYRKTQGKDLPISFKIESMQREGKYRLIALFNGKDLKDIFNDFYENEEAITRERRGFSVAFLKRPKTLPERNVIQDFYVSFSEAGDVLLTNPINSDPPEPLFFRKSGPIAADIEAGYVYNRDEVRIVNDALSANMAVMLYGGAASGKTVIARMIAYNWIKDNKKVCFLHFKTDLVDFNELLKETFNLGTTFPEALLIIEDAHLNPQLINLFLSRSKENWPKLLITSRVNGMQLHGEIVNHFNLLHQIELRIFEPADKIIERYFAENGWFLDSTLQEAI